MHITNYSSTVNRLVLLLSFPAQKILPLDFGLEASVNFRQERHTSALIYLTCVRAGRITLHASVVTTFNLRAVPYYSTTILVQLNLLFTTNRTHYALALFLLLYTICVIRIPCVEYLQYSRIHASLTKERLPYSIM